MSDFYCDPRAIVHDIAEIVRPPRRISVSQCAADVVHIETDGGYSGPWDPNSTPYMVEPMDMLKSRLHRAVVFVAPARCGKTQGLLDGWLAHCVTADPGDIGLYFSTQTLAYDYRKRRIERLHRHSPEIRKRLSSRSHDTTIEMVMYRSGMLLNLGWPTSSQLAQRDLRYVAMTDYDSFPDDIGGEGAAFDLAAKRVQVAMSAGMALVESSPKRTCVKKDWIPTTNHEAPPVAGGILPLYNRGDRRRWYWQCIDGCRTFFEAPAMPAYDDLADIPAASRTAHVLCENCGTVYAPARKNALNASGIWVPDGVEVDAKGNFSGTPVESDIASYWLLGCAAAFQPWKSIVANYLNAKRYAESTGDESSLAATTNTDQGLPYSPRVLEDIQGLDFLASRKNPDMQRYHVPAPVRALLASVDVQANRFEVLVMGHGEHSERWLIDRFSLRQNDDESNIQPGSMLEHWDILLARVINATYRLGDGRTMRVHATAIDSGGRAGVTDLAYRFWRTLIKKSVAHRVHLVKGESGRKSSAMVRRSFPDSSKRSDRPGGGRGDVPVLILNTEKLKNSVYTDLQRELPGPGHIHLPLWLPDKYLKELTAEVRTPTGWQNPTARRNETWDLFVYNRALWHYLGGDGVDWARPPAWLASWDGNVDVLTSEQSSDLREKAPKKRKITIGMPRRQ